MHDDLRVMNNYLFSLIEVNYVKTFDKLGSWKKKGFCYKNKQLQTCYNLALIKAAINFSSNLERALKETINVLLILSKFWIKIRNQIKLMDLKTKDGFGNSKIMYFLHAVFEYIWISKFCNALLESLCNYINTKFKTYKFN